LLRQIDAVLDLSTIRRRLAPYYAAGGRPSIDPELMIRMLLENFRPKIIGPAFLPQAFASD
jgi:transposase